MIEISTVSVLLIAFIINLLLFKMFGVGKRKRYPNGPVGLPVLGHLTFLGKSPTITFSRWRQKYGDVFRIRMGSWNTVVVNSFEAIKEAAEKPDDAFSGRPDFVTQKLLQEITGEISLAFGPFDDIYLQHRKLVATALRHFTCRKSRFTEDLISEEADKLVDNLLKKSGKEPVDIRQNMQYATGSVIYQILYGLDIDLKEQVNRMVESANIFTKFTKSGNAADVLPWLRYLMPWKITGFRNMAIYVTATQKGQIENHIRSFSPGNVRDITDAFLAADMQGKNRNECGLTRSRLLNSTVDLQGAGFDTSNKSLQWLILYMSMYPEVQERVQHEIGDVIGSGCRIELRDKSRLTYTEATILEVMRMTTIIPFAVPKLTIKDTTLGGYDIDKGTVVFFNLHSVSYDKEFWGDPQTFRPERLIDENNRLNVEKCNHILPFGLGRRRCVGEFLARMELFLLFTNVIRRCRFSKPAGESYDMEPDPGLVYSPKAFRVLVEDRQ
ncbi:cytochrome P450 1A1-like [Mercenaria mercenaria]|uniref:cytochrome P450 1A1-like n=1 Tax=Mercenaria mercenaria TaxID=6596 RepID=UPI00234E7B12|nr:cytochrome P450 1A1-like [Mercenaria mercenaria]